MTGYGLDGGEQAIVLRIFITIQIVCNAKEDRGVYKHLIDGEFSNINQRLTMIRLNFKQFIRDRRWFGFSFIVCEISDMREWGFRPPRNSRPAPHKYWIIKQLNKYV